MLLLSDTEYGDDVCRYLRLFHATQPVGHAHLRGIDAECHEHQLCRVQSLFYPGALEGHFFTLFGIAISAAETAVAIAIMINVYRNVRNIQTDDVSDLKG